MFRLLYIRDRYGVDTEQIRGKCGTKGRLVLRKHAVKWALIGVCYGSGMGVIGIRVLPLQGKRS
jgi:hypothetical protein